jgi:hypothetical protein
MATKDYKRLWGSINTEKDEHGAIQHLTNILVDDGKPDEAGGVFISKLGPGDIESCIEILDRVCHNLRFLRLFMTQDEFQGITEGSLDMKNMKIFFNTLLELAKTRERLPRSIRITEKIKALRQIQPHSGRAGLETGEYGGKIVAIKTLKVPTEDDRSKISKVRAKNVQF